MVKTRKQIVGEGATYLSIQIVSSLLSGYIFWILLSKITTADVIGTYSVVVSFADIFANVALFGLPEGIQRFLGRSFSEQNLSDAKVFLKAAAFLLSIGILSCSIIILLASNWIHHTLKIDFTLVIVIVLIIGSSSIYIFLGSIIVSTLKTKVLPKISIVTTAVKILAATLLVLFGGGAIGLAIGYTFVGQVLSALLLGIVIARVFRSTPSTREKHTLKFRSASKNLLIASAATWIPLLIPTIGSDLGTLVVFGSQGSNIAGVYFIALTISTGITSVTYSIFTVALPALSAMQDGRKRFAWQTIRLSTIVSSPLIFSVIFYSKEIMGVIGHAYVVGSLSLQILLLSVLPMTVLTGIDTLVYSYGNYRKSLIIGLAMNIPRVALYFALVPIFGSTGAAIGYTAGSMVGFGLSIGIAKQISMKIKWSELGIICIIPFSIAFVVFYFKVNFIIGIFVTFIVSFIIFLRLRVLSRSEVKGSIEILPYRISKPATSLLDKAMNLLLGD